MTLMNRIDRHTYKGKTGRKRVFGAVGMTEVDLVFFRILFRSSLVVILLFSV